MDAFEENLKTFNSTIYGKEMRDALHRCFNLIKVEIEWNTKKLAEIESRINALKKGGD